MLTGGGAALNKRKRERRTHTRDLETLTVCRDNLCGRRGSKGEAGEEIGMRVMSMLVPLPLLYLRARTFWSLSGEIVIPNK